MFNKAYESKTWTIRTIITNSAKVESDSERIRGLIAMEKNSVVSLFSWYPEQIA